MVSNVNNNTIFVADKSGALFTYAHMVLHKSTYNFNEVQNMNPKFSITNKILGSVADIAELIGLMSSTAELNKNPTLRRENRIKTVYGSLSIEQNTLSIEQVTAVIDGKRVLAPPKDIEEVKNAFEIYDILDTLDPYSVDDLLKSHSVMMRGLVDGAGYFRQKPVGVADSKTGEIIHFGTLPAYVPEAIYNLIDWTKNSELHPLVKSCVFHYEFELIHPFLDGNGRCGRLWHTLLLSKWNPIFAWLPVESMVHRHQQEYYDAINKCNDAGDSTVFIEFMLDMIKSTLAEANETTCSAEQVEEQVEEQVIKRILDYCSVPRTRTELQKLSKISGRKAFVEKYLKPLLASGKLVMTVPDRPNSRNQKYVKPRT